MSDDCKRLKMGFESCDAPLCDCPRETMPDTPSSDVQITEEMFKAAIWVWREWEDSDEYDIREFLIRPMFEAMLAAAP